MAKKKHFDKLAQGPRFRNILLAILSGGLLTAAWPTWGIASLAFVGFVPLLLIEARIANGEKGRLFWLSFLAFFIWNVGHHLVGVERHSCRNIGLDSQCTLYGHRFLCVSPHQEKGLQQPMGQFLSYSLLDGL